MQKLIRNFLATIRADGIQGGKINRDPRYVIIFIISLIILALSTLQANDVGFLDSVERPVFNFFNTLPSLLLPIFFAVTQFGAFLILPLWLLLAYGLGKFRLVATVALSGTSAWLTAKVMKAFIGRARPEGILDTIQLISQEVFTGNGYPSGHAAFSAACIVAIYFHLQREHRKYALLLLTLVGVSRMYLGAHFPLDIVGGWALGAIAASIFSLLLGTKRSRISYAALRKKLKTFGYDVESIKQLNVDARGSVPLKATTRNGQELFIKAFGRQEHAADWLFKSQRFFRYKSKFNENAHFSSKHNMEIEALGGLWARQSGIRTPKTLVMFPLGSRWLLVQEHVNAKPLDSYKKVQTKTIEDIWKQLSKLHKANISHRDLRAANIMVRPDGLVYIIDFGFAEISPSVSRKRIDIAQLLVSLTLLTSAERAINGALKHLSANKLRRSLPYIQKTILPAATRTELKKQNAPVLENLISELKQKLNIRNPVDKENLKRINLKRVVLLVVAAFFLYSIVPQFNDFKDSLSVLADAKIIWLFALLFASGFTYVFSALVLYFLTNIPLKIKGLFYTQLAGSFASKLVPGGVGAASLNLRYLTQNGMSVGEASGILTAERLVGLLGVLAIIIMFGVFGGADIQELIDLDLSIHYIFAAAAIIAVIIAAIKWSEKVKNFISKFMTDAANQFRNLLHTPDQLLYAFLSGLGVTVMYVACLYFSLVAVGASLPLLELFVVYIGSMLAKGVSPTPGGLGALEVAMVAALQGFGVEASVSYATVVLYRLATYWIPLPFGLLAYKLKLEDALK